MKPVDLTCTHLVRPAPEDVWDYVATRYFDHHVTWDPAITAMVKISPGPLGVGTVGEEVRRFGGRQRARFEVTAFDRPQRFAFHTTSGPFALERCYSLAPAEGGTLLTFRFTMRPRGAARPVFPLVRGTVERQVLANIARLARLLDGPDVSRRPRACPWRPA